MDRLINLSKFFLIILFFNINFNHSAAEILIFKNCKSEKYDFEKNDLL